MRKDEALRLLGWIFLVVALAALGLDAVETAGAGDPFRLRAIGEYWHRIHSGSLQVFQPAVERHVSPLLWDPVIITFLEWSLAIVAGVLAFVMLLLGRRRGRDRRDDMMFGKK